MAITSRRGLPVRFGGSSTQAGRVLDWSDSASATMACLSSEPVFSFVAVALAVEFDCATDSACFVSGVAGGFSDFLRLFIEAAAAFAVLPLLVLIATGGCAVGVGA